jgi:uncharacterized membrane protein
MKFRNIIHTIIILSIIGIFASVYLLQNHYAPTQTGAICDISETISCSLVNISTYATLLNVPVALFGILWFVVLALIAWQLLKKKNDTLIPIMLVWALIGTIFITYMIIAEIILKALCPFCTLVHIIIIVLLVLTIQLYRRTAVTLTSPAVRNAAKPWIIGIALLFIIPIILFNTLLGNNSNYDDFARCITENGIDMYGSFRCGICARERVLFGDSWRYVNEIECHPQAENAQTERCIAKDIEGTPTWIMEIDGQEIKRHVGYMSIKELEEFSGCTAQ